MIDDESTEAGGPHGSMDDAGQEKPREETVPRTPPKVDPARSALVDRWNSRVEQAARVHEKRFDRIRELQRFAKGEQWPRGQEDNYTVNLTLRHVNQRVAKLYAKNPKAIARVRPRLEYTVWDGNMASIQEAQQTLQMAAQAQPALAESPQQGSQALVMQAAQQAQSVLADFEKARETKALYDRLARTVVLLYDYNVDEQDLPFKSLMKKVVRRTVTTGIGWVKLGFQRATQLRPEYESRISDMATQLRRVEQASADMADGVLMPDSADAEQLRLEIENLRKEGTVLIREGLTFDYPSSTSVIPDLNCRCLKTFLGCRWVAQQFLLPAQEIQRIYGVDVSAGGTKRYTGRMSGSESGSLANSGRSDSSDLDPKAEMYLLREIYCKDSGMVYVVCDGFPDFLQEPGPPEVWTERFWPWYGLVFNEVDEDEEAEDIWPPSDVELIMDPQREINRSREALREHRVANRPGYAAAAGMLSEGDKDKLEQRPAHAVLEMQSLQPGQKIDDLLQPMKGAPIDPNLYQTNAQFEDILRAGGHQEANLGGTGGATATESSIAESSLSVSNNSSVDDLDDLLTALARSGGQILLLNVSREKVTEIVGPGAVWPELSRDQVARELWLEIEAGSTGRPNQAQEIANAERIYPLLMQIPGMDPVELGRELIRRLDDRLDIDKMLAAGMPSVTAMNGQQQPGTGDPATDPAQQGAQGAQNAPAPALPPGAAQGVDVTSGMPDMLS